MADTYTIQVTTANTHSPHTTAQDVRRLRLMAQRLRYKLEAGEGDQHTAGAAVDLDRMANALEFINTRLTWAVAYQVTTELEKRA